MPNLTIYKTLTYTDPDSDTSYTMTATKVLSAEIAQRFRLSLSTAANTEIYQNNVPGLSPAKLLYMNIKNVGAGSAYILMDDTSNTVIHEIAAGASFDLFGEDIYFSSYLGTVEIISQIFAKGNTEIEVDIFF
jgi:hypothetical protein